ncbi:NADH-quinone oxidoreductase subunit D [Candidatus Bathyarchaeota archaeon]|nr:MAG: NADH-quinone oxidoreductase subunit D [Candidatus Bathyarchaeota archaeon]
MIREALKSLKSGFQLLKSKPITYNFPPETPLAKEFRGRHIFDPTKCRSCGLCAKICPNKAIEMVEEGGTPSSSQVKVRHPQIDYAKCCFCGLCADICPTGALRMTNFPMLVAMDKSQLLFPPEKLAQPPELKMPEKPKIKNLTSWARSRSLWVINFFTGCCFIEAIPWVSSGFDMERFGLLVADSPRHADIFIIAGYVTWKTLKRIIRIYEQTPPPKFVVALGNCPATGGTYWDSYNTVKKIDDYIPVDIWIAGCPPRPEPIGLAVVEAMNAIQSGYTGKKEEVKTSEKLRVPATKEKLEENEFLLPFGPQHPASGNFQLKLKIDGENIVEAEPQVGYLHRGFEKLMEYRTWMQNVMLVERICVLDGGSYEVGYSVAVEKLAGLEPPERAQHLRVIQAELSRIQSHLLNLGLIGGATGFHTIQRITWGDREKILYLLERLTGGRIYHIYSIPGGVRRDLKEEFKKEAVKVLAYMRKRLKTYDELFIENPVFRKRTLDIGKLKAETALENDVTGPNLRASGIKFDVRKSTPYLAYDQLDFEIPTFKEGDAYHRTLVRRMEIEESLNIIEQALKKIPSGAFKVRFAPFATVPEGEAMSFIESARGELCFHMVSSGTNMPYRVKVRGPTFDTILVMLPKILKGAKIADVPVIYWSLDNCPADHDR